MSVLANRRHREAEIFVEQNYERWRRKIVSRAREMLSHRRMKVRDDDVQSAYNLAWHELHKRLLANEAITSPQRFLLAVTYRRACDAWKQSHVDRFANVDVGDLTASERDVAERLDDQVALAHVREGLRERLNDRELQAATLCYLYGFTRDEACEVMGVAPRTLERLMDGSKDRPGVAKVFAQLTREIRSGAWCDRRVSLMNAFAHGILDPEGQRYQLARQHLETCSACRRYVQNVRQLAAIMPPVALPLGISDSPAATEVLERLYALFEPAGNGVVDVARDTAAHLVTQADAALGPSGVAGAGQVVRATGAGGAAAGTAAAAATAGGGAASGGVAVGGLSSLLAGGGGALGLKIAAGCAATAMVGAACVAITDKVAPERRPAAKVQRAETALTRTTNFVPSVGAPLSPGVSTASRQHERQAAAGAPTPQSKSGERARSGDSAPSAGSEFGFAGAGQHDHSTSGERANSSRQSRSQAAPSAPAEFGVGAASTAGTTSRSDGATATASPPPSTSSATGARQPSGRGQVSSAASEFGFGG